MLPVIFVRIKWQLVELVVQEVPEFHLLSSRVLLPLAHT